MYINICVHMWTLYKLRCLLLTSLLYYSHMYESFDPYSVCLYMTKATKRLYDIQCLLYQTVMTGTQFRGLEILRPSTISQPVRIQLIHKCIFTG